MRTLGIKLKVPLEDYGAYTSSTHEELMAASKLAQRDIKSDAFVRKMVRDIFRGGGSGMVGAVADLTIEDAPRMTDATAYGKWSIFEVSLGFPGKVDRWYWPMRVFVYQGHTEPTDLEDAFFERIETLQSGMFGADLDHLLDGYSDGFLLHVREKVADLILSDNLDHGVARGLGMLMTKRMAELDGRDGP